MRRPGHIAPWLAFAVLLTSGPAVAQIYRLPAPDSTSGNWFGTAVAVSGERIVVGATGVDACGPNSGAAYVYEPGDDFTWHLDAVLRPDECVEEGFFGRAVEIEGDRIVVTAFRPYFSTFRSNAVHVFERTEDGEWVHDARIDSPGRVAEDAFASSVGLSGDRLLVTSTGDSNDSGSTPHDGVAYLFERDRNGNWELEARLEGAAGSGAFGASCALEGEIAVVSASTASRRDPGTVFVFGREEDGNWTRRATFGGIRDFFIPMAMDDARLLVGQRDAGRVRSGVATLFETGADGRWQGTARLRNPVPYPAGGFGSGVALSGDRALVAGYDEQLQFDYNIDRVVHVFVADQSGKWAHGQVIDVGETHFGSALAADGNLATIGAATDAVAGAVYVVRLQ